MISAVEFCHILLRDHLRPGDWALDGTAGNGHDALFLSRQTGESGQVFAFDIQPRAVEITRSLLEAHGIAATRCRPLCACHSEIPRHLPREAGGRLSAAIFNLGYLPGGDKSVITRPDTTALAIASTLPLLRPGGLMLIVLYPGHPGGAEEAERLRDLAGQLPPREFHVSEFKTLHTRAPGPEVLILSKSAGSKPAAARAGSTDGE